MILIAYKTTVALVIFFVFISWIINEFFNESWCISMCNLQTKVFIEFLIAHMTYFQLQQLHLQAYVSI